MKYYIRNVILSPNNGGDYSSFSAFGLQQHFPVSPKMTSSAPITVRAILPQLTFNQAKTITSAAKMTLQ